MVFSLFFVIRFSFSLSTQSGRIFDFAGEIDAAVVISPSIRFLLLLC